MIAETPLLDSVTDHDEYRCAPMVRFPLGGSSELLYFPLRKTARIVAPPEARLLAACSQFAPLEGHSERIAGALAAGTTSGSDVLEALRTFAADGMMLSYSELMNRVASLPRPAAPPRIAWLAIPTCNRPSLLRRALRSYAAHFSRTSRFPKLLVADDSRTPKANRATKAVVEEQARTWGAAVVYSGPGEKRRLIDQLAADGSLPREVLETGILGIEGDSVTTGANRNAIMLHTAGEMVLSADDDTLCQPCAAPGSEPGVLRLGKEGDPAECRFFADRDSALASVRPVDVDILAEHEALLGRRVRTLVEPAAQNGADLDSACNHLIRDIWTGAGRVLITLNGSVGDSGMYTPPPFMLSANPEIRRRLIESAEAYRLALSSRELTRQAPSASVCHGGPFIGMFFGVDNRDILPPFFPVGPNEDGIMGYMVGECLEVECRYFGCLPWSLVHDPPSGRTYITGIGATVSIWDLLVACVSVWGRPARRTDTAGRLRSLGLHLAELASMQPDEFEELMRTTLWRQFGQRIATQEDLLSRYRDQPGYWANDLRKEIEASLKALSEPGFGTPGCILADRSQSGHLRDAQNLIGRYGRLVNRWPDITDRAKELERL